MAQADLVLLNENIYLYNYLIKQLLPSILNYLRFTLYNAKPMKYITSIYQTIFEHNQRPHF